MDRSTHVITLDAPQSDAFAHLREAILTGAIGARSRIRDAEVAARLGVERADVRRALASLERLGMVVRTRTRSFRVALDGDDGLEAAAECLGIECGVAIRLGVPRMLDEERALGSALCLEAAAVCEAAPLSIALVYEAALAAFGHLVGATGNPYLRNSYEAACAAVLRSTRGEHRLLNPPTFVAARFRELAGHLAAGDARAAEHAAGRLFRVEIGETVR
ncbi:GntR family transcriptional regulator [Microbacterium sp. NPDC055683]